MIAIAKEKAQAAGASNVDFEVADIESFAPPAEAFDVILAHSILHLLPDAKNALDTFRRWLKPGGLLISSTPCIGDFLPIFRYIGPIGYKLGLLPRVNVFTQDDLFAWFDASGFDVEDRFQPSPRNGIYVVARKR